MFDILALCYSADMYQRVDPPASVVLRRWVGGLASSEDGTAPHVLRGRGASIEAESPYVVGILPFCNGRGVLSVVEIPTYLGGI